MDGSYPGQSAGPYHRFLRHRFPPSSPPPIPPKYSSGVDRMFFRNTAHLLSYLWLRNRQEFWVFPTGLTPTAMRGYRWDGGSWRPVTIQSGLIDRVF